MITFLAPELSAASHASGGPVVRCLEGLVQAAYSRLPEHRLARERVTELNHRSLRIAEAYSSALPDDLQEFWEAYAGWFAMYSVGPLLANAQVAQQVAEERPERRGLVVENLRSRGWWSGRDDLEASVGETLRQAGWEVRLQPRGAWRSLKGAAVRALAAQQGKGELRELQRAVAEAETPGPPQPVDILFLAVGASSVDLIARLMPEASRRGLASAILDFDYFGSAATLKGRSLPFHSLAAFLRSDEVRRKSPSPCAEIHEGLPETEGMTAGQQAALAARLDVVLARDARPWVLRATASHRALDGFQPKLVVGFHTYGPVMAPTVIAARRRAIPRLCLQHGVIGPRYLALPCLPYDEKLVFGRYAQGIMTAACPELPVTVTGHALYDVGEKPVQPRPEVLALREGVRALVVLCTQFNEPEYYRPDHWWMQEVAETCQRLGVRLAIKLHPSDTPRNVRLYQQVLREGDDLVQLVRHGTLPLNELLAACDLMITRDSTVVFEANLLHKPALTVNLSEWDEELPYAATGGALGVSSFDEIAPAIEAALFDPQTRQRLAESREEFLLEHTGPRDGGATERIGEAMERWCAQERR